jgi:hypothetical protein
VVRFDGAGNRVIEEVHARTPDHADKSRRGNHKKCACGAMRPLHRHRREPWSLRTISFKLLYGLVILRHARRRLVRISVTTNPTGEWIVGQVADAFPWDEGPRHFGPSMAVIFKVALICDTDEDAIIASLRHEDAARRECSGRVASPLRFSKSLLYVGELVQESELVVRQTDAPSGERSRLAARVVAPPLALSPNGCKGRKSRIARRGKPR